MPILRFPRRTFLLLCLAGAVSQSAPPQERGQSLFSQSAKAELEGRFGGSELSWLLLNSSANVIAQHWDDVRTPVAPGSLLKPFLAAAYAEQHGGRFPREYCAGTRSRCWLPKGHGALGLTEAIAQSCNTYFLLLAADLDRRHAAATFAHYGLAGPPPTAAIENFAGLGAEWRETPMTLAAAYLRLLSAERDPAIRMIAGGMESAAQRGTASGIDRALGPGAALAKTGTAPCSHRPRGSADGFAIVLYPAHQPRLLLLLRKHQSTGAQTAVVAGEMLRAIGMGAP